MALELQDRLRMTHIRVRVFASFLLAVAASALPACSEDDSAKAAAPGPAPAPTSEAIAAFRSAFLDDDYGAIDTVVERLESEAKLRPADGSLATFTGLAYFWRLAEAGRRSSPPEASFLGATVGGMVRNLERAASTLPYDDRLDSWLGTAKVIEGEAGNAAAREEGLALLQKGAQSYPAFNLFSIVIGAFLEPAGTPGFQAAVDGVYGTFAACVGDPLNSDNPDFTPYVAREPVTKTGQEYACWSTERAPHALEGVFLAYGDVLLKARRVAAARRYFENAKVSKSYPTWKYKARLEERLGAGVDLDDLSARFADADPDNDPKSVLTDNTTSCRYCHAR